MKKFSRRAINNQEKVEKRLYSIKEGIFLVKQTANANFIESIEAHISLAINPKYNDQQLRSTLILPKGTGKRKRIAVLMPLEKSTKEYQNLADRIGFLNLIEEIEKGEIDFDILISTPEMMPKIAKLGKILGPKGLMPSPKSGTITTNITLTLEDFRKGKIEYKVDKTGIVHLIIGNSNFQSEDLLENLTEVFNSIKQSKPSGVKGRYLKKLHLCSTMGPSIEIDILTLKV
uniref:Ribosomal protein n=1 Tax=Phaeophyceae sp. TaxID=2249243 RepID=A0A8E5F8R5_9PHAE|nr:ribosomal protein L1 [Phaeophyceae sp.]